MNQSYLKGIGNEGDEERAKGRRTSRLKYQEVEGEEKHHEHPGTREATDSQLSVYRKNLPRFPSPFGPTMSTGSPRVYGREHAMNEKLATHLLLVHSGVFVM